MRSSFSGLCYIKNIIISNIIIAVTNSLTAVMILIFLASLQSSALEAAIEVITAAATKEIIPIIDERTTPIFKV